MDIYIIPVRDRVIHILKQCAKIPDDILDISYWDKPLTGQYFGLSAVDMVYLFFEIESEFNIQIQPESLRDYQFGSINSICEIVQKNLSQNVS